MTDTFKFTQNISFKNFLEVYLYELRRMKIVSRIFILVTIVGIVRALLDFTSPTKHQIPWYILIFKLIMAPLFLIAFALIVGSLIAFLLMLLRPTHFKDVEFEFNNWGMVKKGKGFEFSRPWGGFTQFRETKSFIFLYITAYDAHIIKKSAFHSDTLLNDFKILIHEKFS